MLYLCKITFKTKIIANIRNVEKYETKRKVSQLKTETSREIDQYRDFRLRSRTRFTSCGISLVGFADINILSKMTPYGCFCDSKVMAGNVYILRKNFEKIISRQ